MFCSDRKRDRMNRQAIIGIFTGPYPAGHSPGVVQLAEALAETGYEVDFFTKGVYAGELEFRNQAVRLESLDLKADKKRKERKKLRNLIPLEWRRAFLYKSAGAGTGLLSRLVDNPRRYVLECSYLNRATKDTTIAEDLSGEKKYRCFIGVEAEGLARASIMGRKFGVPVVYLSTGNSRGEDEDLLLSVLNKYEAVFAPGASLIIMADRKGTEARLKGLGITKDKVELLPSPSRARVFDKKKFTKVMERIKGLAGDGA